MPAATVRLHRVPRAPPERVCRAFLGLDAMPKWLPPQGSTGRAYHADARAVGASRISFTDFAAGEVHAFGDRHLELAPGERLRCTEAFDGPGLPGEMATTVSLEPVSCGTELPLAQENIRGAIPVAACRLGWQEPLALLAFLVEAEVPG